MGSECGILTHANAKTIAKQVKVGMIWVAGRSPTLVSHSEAWRSHES